MPQTRHTVLVLLALAATLAPAGCGGSSGGRASRSEAVATRAGAQKTAAAAPSVAPLAHTAFAAKASAICGRLYREQASLKGVKVRTNKDLERVAAGLKAHEDRALAELSKLVPPASLASEWSAMVHDARTLASEVGEMFGQIGREGITSASAARLNTEIEALTARAHAIARRERLGECARGI